MNGFNLRNPVVFGHYKSTPRRYSFNGMPGWWTVPAGYFWYIAIDAGLQTWVSPNPITKNSNGTVSGSPLYAAETNLDGTLVFQDKLAQRYTQIDSPPSDWLSQPR